MRSRFFRFALPALVATFVALGSSSIFAQGKKWVGTWSTGVQLVETANMPPSPGLTNNTLRQIVCPSIGGDTLRVRFSNNFSTDSCVINSATIAVSTGKSTIDVSTLKQLKFKGSASVTMLHDSAVTSDPVAFNLTPRMKVTISIYYGRAPSSVTGHPGSRTTSWLMAGKQDTAASFALDTFSHWYNIQTIDVWTSSSAGAVAILGNSICDGRGSITDSNNRWPDVLAKRLLANPATQNVGVLNLGIGGGCVFSLNSSCLGPSALNRYTRDIINQSGVRWLIVAEGVNDIGILAKTSAGVKPTSDSLILAYKQIIAAARDKGMKVYGATIMPFNGNSYYTTYSESCRQTVNTWIRTSGYFDSIIDFDKILRSPTDSTKLRISTFQNDGLHPTYAGYDTMGRAINLDLFTQSGSAVKEAAVPKSPVLGDVRMNRVNGITRVSFQLPREAFVSLKVYSIAGQEIAELAGKKFAAGAHTLQFKSANLAKGMYLYSLRVDNLAANRMVIY